MNIKVVLADDHKLIRQGLCAMLEKEKDITVVAQAENGREAARLVDELNPDVVILDINMPDLNGIDAAKLISSNNKNTRIILLASKLDQDMILVFDDYLDKQDIDTNYFYFKD